MPDGSGDCAKLWATDSSGNSRGGLIDDGPCTSTMQFVCEFNDAVFVALGADDDECGCQCDGQASYFVLEVAGLEGVGSSTLILFSAILLCIVCLSCLLCKNYQTARAKGYGKVVMDTEAEELCA